MRVNLSKVEPEVPRLMYSIRDYVVNLGIEQTTRDLIYIRASQINGCAYCLDMHIQDARANGENEQRIGCIQLWRDSPFFTERERLALEFTEALTEVSRNGITDELYNRVRAEYDEHEYIGLIMTVNLINNWNRIMIACGGTAGLYRNDVLRESGPDFFFKTRNGS